MISTYIFALLFALAAIWVFQRTSEDVYMVLAVVITLICSVVGFAHAHWIVQVTIALSLFLLDQFLRLRTNP